MMTFTEYRRLAVRTLPTLGVAAVYHDNELIDFHKVDLDVLHVIMGMSSEFGEICDSKDSVNLGEEIADTAWYVANYANLRGIDVEIRSCTYDDVYGSDYGFMCRPQISVWLQRAISDLTDMEKKMFVYDKRFPIDTLRTQLQHILDCITIFCSEQGIDIHEALEKNINKLKVRYPNKFTIEDAVNRNLDAERRMLE